MMHGAWNDEAYRMQPFARGQKLEESARVEMRNHWREVEEHLDAADTAVQAAKRRPNVLNTLRWHGELEQWTSTCRR